MPSQLTARPDNIPLNNLYNLLEPITVPSKNARFTNWGQTFACTPSAIFEPENEFQCELVLELARREGKTVRLVGVGHSPSDLACTDEFMLRTTKLNRIIEVILLLFRVLQITSCLCRPSPHRSAQRNDMLLLREESPSMISTSNWQRIT
jgi:hypothetical protein